MSSGVFKHCHQLSIDRLWTRCCRPRSGCAERVIQRLPLKSSSGLDDLIPLHCPVDEQVRPVECQEAPVKSLKPVDNTNYPEKLLITLQTNIKEYC